MAGHSRCICVGRITNALPHLAGCPMGLEEATRAIQEIEVLTAAEAREVRRKSRKLTRTEQDIGLRILKRAARILDRGGRPEKAVQIIMRGFGGIILSKLKGKIGL